MMYESKRPDVESVKAALPQAEQVVEWLAARDQAEQTIRASLGGLPGEREVRLARMADVLQATAQGLGPQAAAVWAGVPEHLLQQWLANDVDFAAAVRAASALASVNGLEPGEPKTPAMIRVVILAMTGGESFETASEVVGLSPYKLRKLWHASPTLVALVDAARRVRPRKPRAYVPSTYRPRRAGPKPPSASRYRLVQRDES
ncbi:hypothetical protein [Streptomyces sp. CS-7]|uniref:hypothetical protein n=1 Tax=Streptomyces sp. CS-7 TaxID=2906769 RepID=UPI0021B1CDCF|nr:hypothetical protein [Streptomyces sp. CS-7]